MSRTPLVRVHNNNNFDLRADEVGLPIHHRVAVLGNFGGKADQLDFKLRRLERGFGNLAQIRLLPEGL
ncbi:MAG: hypothetical protein KF824_11735 [Fimbriimonadaceae bacterium]|nr:MAG: hypothetical protein KF824_11735 [Fimbriimonadaceae bacterium]